MRNAYGIGTAQEILAFFFPPQAFGAQGSIRSGSNFLSTSSCHKSMGRLPGFGVEGNLIPVSLLFALFSSEFRP